MKIIKDFETDAPEHFESAINHVFADTDYQFKLYEIFSCYLADVMGGNIPENKQITLSCSKNQTKDLIKDLEAKKQKLISGDFKIL